MKFYKICIFQLILITGCGMEVESDYDEIVTKWIGKEIVFPGLNDDDFLPENQKDLKIVTRINGNCFSCLTHLEIWKKFMNNILQNERIPFYFYLVIADSSIYNKINNEIIHFDYPVIFDPDDQFRKKNNLNENNIFHTMLVDANNKVIIIGNPVNNVKMQNLYREIINEYRK